MCGDLSISHESASRRVLRGFTVTDHVYRKGLMLARHCHSKTNLTVVVSGEYTETFRGKSELCKGGTLRLLPAGEHHANRFDHDSRCLVVEVDPQSFHCFQTSAAIYAQAGQIQSPLVEHLGHRLFAEFRTFDDLSPLVIEGILFGVLAEAERVRRIGKRGPVWLGTVNQILRERFADDLGLDEIAAAAGVHPVYLCREFKKRHQVTVGTLVRQLRISHACELLRNTKMPLAEIALQCGFADQSHFSVVFKRTMGATPSAFRTA